MKRLKEISSSKISSNNDIVNKNLQDYTNLGQKKKPHKFTGKKKRLFKSFGIGAMAVFMSILTVFGTACTPASITPANTNQDQNFDLGLNPETDPVVFTTQSGLEIKKSNAKYGSITTTTTNTGYSYTQDLTSFYYFTMGTFSGTIYTAKTQTDTYTVNNLPVNWLIIGRGPGFNFESNTPAGSAIQGDVNKQEIAFSNKMYECMDLSSIPEHADIPKGCMLVLSEKLLGQMYFNSSGNLNTSFYTGYAPSYLMYSSGGHYGNRYRYYGNTSVSTAGDQSWTNKTDGSLYKYINNLFSKNNSTGIIEGENKLGFTQTQAQLIIPQQLYTYYSNGDGYNYAETPSTDGGTYYTMFPLAYRNAHSATKQNFCIEDYLTTNAKRIATFIGSSTNQPYFWRLRSGSSSYCWRAYYINPPGEYEGTHGEDCSFGVRPAMVMKLA